MRDIMVNSEQKDDAVRYLKALDKGQGSFLKGIAFMIDDLFNRVHALEKQLSECNKTDMPLTKSAQQCANLLRAQQVRELARERGYMRE